MADVDFKQIVSDAGIPTTEAELNAAWKEEVTNAGSTISNDSDYSPFWRVITALVTKPVLWLINFLIETVLPNAFLKTAVFDWAVELLADAVNLTRKDETFTTGEITFTRGEIGTSVTIPKDTIVQTPTLNGKVYQVKVTQATSFLSGLSTVRVPVKAVEAGSAFNLAAGYYSILPVPM
ncbi:baseplate J/gp47 family protein, partial [Methylophaga sp. UBA5088]